jgi:hypothetical protein
MLTLSSLEAWGSAPASSALRAFSAASRWAFASTSTASNRCTSAATHTGAVKVGSVTSHPRILGARQRPVGRRALARLAQVGVLECMVSLTNKKAPSPSLERTLRLSSLDAHPVQVQGGPRQKEGHCTASTKSTVRQSASHKHSLPRPHIPARTRTRHTHTRTHHTHTRTRTRTHTHTPKQHLPMPPHLARQPPLVGQGQTPGQRRT